MRQILVTSALPYANGHIHLGHLVEYIQTDIWVRFQRLAGNRCVFVCADDTHGTAISIRPSKKVAAKKAVIADMKAAHERDFAGFRSVSTIRQHEQSLESGALRRSGRKNSRRGPRDRKERHANCSTPWRSSFLPTAMFVATVPSAERPDQYGDSCDKCGAAYSPTDLTNPVSALSGATPELKSSRIGSSTRNRCTTFWRLDAQRSVARGCRQLAGRRVPGRAAARLGCVAPGTLFRFRDSRRAGELLVRLVRRSDRLHGQHERLVRSSRREVRRLVA